MKEKVSKILVIEDWEQFLKDLNIATLESVCVVADVECELLKHELKDAIQFEADVQTANETLKKPLVVFSPGSDLEDHFADDEEVNVTIFRKKE